MAAPSADNRGPEVVNVAVATIVLSIVTVALRCWSKALSKTADFWWDDWTAIASLPFIIALSSLAIYWESIGFGRHLTPTSDATALLLPLYVLSFLYNTGLVLVKLSVLLFYYRIFGRVRWFRIALWAMAGLVMAWFIAVTLLAAFTCTPTRKSWKPEVPGHCLDSFKTYLGAAAPNVLTDFFLLVLPLPMLWALSLRLSKKVGLSVVFMLGYCVIIISIIRVVSVARLTPKAHKDFTWSLVTAIIYVLFETPIALISICLPSIFHLVKRTLMDRFPNLFSRAGPSEPLSASGGSRIGPMGNPIDENKKNHSGRFARLHDDTFNSRISHEALVGVSGKSDYHATAFPDPYVLNEERMRNEDAELGLAMQPIHIRKEIDVTSGRNGRM